MNCYKELSEEYIKAYEIDAKDTKVGLILNTVTIILALIVGLITYILKFNEFPKEKIL